MTLNEQYEQLLERFRDKLKFLPDKPEETPESTVKALWLAAAERNCSAEKAIDEQLPELKPAQMEKLDKYVSDRLSGKPLAHITGRQQFMGLELMANSQALIPRKETELLGFSCIDLIEQLKKDKKELKLIDVCTGSGNLAVNYAIKQPDIQVYASDLTKESIDLARENVSLYSLEDRVHLYVGDLLQPFDSPEFHESVDIISCNPPYITSNKVGDMNLEISKHEPKEAFDGGPFGVNIVNRLIKESAKLLTPGGWLIFEVGLGQGPVMKKRLDSSKEFHDVRTYANEAGDIRVLAARKNN